MHLSPIRILSIMLLALIVSSCTPLGRFLEGLVEVSQRVNERMTVKVPPLPAHPLYVLVVSARRFGNNQLVIVDADTWQVTRHTSLLGVAPWDFSRDPQGRIWIGYGAQPGGDTRVQIFAPDGSLLKTMSLCADPFLPIHFAAGRAFVPCHQSGFEAAVVIIDLTSLEVIQQVDIRIPDDDFLLAGTGGDDDYFVFTGSGHISNRVILLDTRTLVTLEPLPIPDSYPMTIVAYRERFLLLNSVAELLLSKDLVEALPAGRPDLLIVDTNPTPTFSIYQMVAPGALWGIIKGDTLYTYHDAQRLGLNPNPFRAVSRLNLVTDEAELWRLPDGWDARDLAVYNGEILLAHSIAPEPETAGIYRFDPATGELTLLVNIPGAQRLLLPAEK